MKRPLHLARHIKLTVDDALDKVVARDWLRSAIDAGPSGVVATVQGVDDDGAPHAIKLVHREADGQHSYLIPLTRDLNPLEVERIARCFAERQPKLDFDIETHETRLAGTKGPSISLDHAEHLALCTALEKQKHEDWVRERADAGWRYGAKFSLGDKTHPLLRPWNELPDRYKRPDLEMPQKLVHALGQQGYVVIARDELDKMMAELRR